MLEYESSGSCSGYSKAHVPLHFAPTCATAFNVPLLVEFAAVHGLQPPPLRVMVACVAGGVLLLLLLLLLLKQGQVMFRYTSLMIPWTCGPVSSEKLIAT